jgi:GST-like protein
MHAVVSPAPNGCSGRVSGLGPKAGQSEHFNLHAAEKISYAIDRYTRETTRLYGVLNRRLDGREYICGEEYSIADIACYPWIVSYAKYSQKLEDFPHLQRWSETIRARPATARAYAQGDFRKRQAQLGDVERKVLFGQGKPV